ncbi:hypothetical protein DLM78_08760 [Leptospira stimsonii]|uniref:Uncharacterized protein n=1 Tax=Leptospira stimsonii TaxID=2202203 RepID=A0A8B6RYC6_9LEPT|nr:hypothetical protein DLM78_08760 [Leptospira stimsonii]
MSALALFLQSVRVLFFLQSVCEEEQRVSSYFFCLTESSSFKAVNEGVPTFSVPQKVPLSKL